MFYRDYKVKVYRVRITKGYNNRFWYSRMIDQEFDVALSIKETSDSHIIPAFMLVDIINKESVRPRAVRLFVRPEDCTVVSEATYTTDGSWVQYISKKFIINHCDDKDFRRSKEEKV